MLENERADSLPRCNFVHCDRRAQSWIERARARARMERNEIFRTWNEIHSVCINQSFIFYSVIHDMGRNACHPLSIISSTTRERFRFTPMCAFLLPLPLTHPSSSPSSSSSPSPKSSPFCVTIVANVRYFALLFFLSPSHFVRRTLRAMYIGTVG